MKKLIALGSISLTLTLSSMLAVAPANAGRGRMMKFASKLVYLCPQFDNLKKQIEAIEESPNPDFPLCSEPDEQPEGAKSEIKPFCHKKETKLLPISKLTQSEPKLEKQQVGCWKWYRSVGWVWVC